MDIVTVYKKLRKQFGRYSGHFVDTEPEMIVDIKPSEEFKQKYINREPRSVGAQAVAEFSEHFTNTETHETKEQGMMHNEGGWPKDVDTSKLSSKERYIKKIENNIEDLNSFISLRDNAEYYIQQNNAINIFGSYFKETVQDFGSERSMVKTVSVFKDPCQDKRTATKISWLPSDGSKLAVAYANLDFQSSTKKIPTNAYVWDVNNANEPDVTLLPSSHLTSIRYNPKENSTVAGGCYNGVVCIFDTRKGGEEVLISDLKTSHRDPIYDIQWLQSKSATFFISTSTDGQVLTWDTRNLSNPVDSETLELRIPDDKNGECKLQGLLGGESIDYDVSYSPTKFMIGTEQGAVLSCTRRKNKGTAIDKVYYGHHHHHGPIYSIQRNPFLQKYFMTVGDWTHLIKPLLSLRLSDQGLHTLSVYGKYIAVGGRDGSTRLLEVSEGLRGEEKQQVLEEKEFINNMLERETKRERALIDNRKESEQAQRRIEAKKKQREQSSKTFTLVINESELQEDEDMFLQAIKKK
ncbi:hypothetical protein NAEGRDRAFT_60431 [Naegleria gruberi]|uniref:Uncharacterized protein n=1 Tax=Naegleria gruberi TaxID=5762 RepID=D2V864_NAEGR|nr:uncharacterized protein NAEGRDRAFT_60431 [Naegleria gruberi]EFC47121.1 hypothetical protein NAEGRDRAFT_60431 [Naegleria gruberi]|eukprot:XP_002679865.1 hypothetical protein NAEGRDRAFT_60431 [Naegleria gruberi strain NEG-M]